jgi:hypothetical protein
LSSSQYNEDTVGALLEWVRQEHEEERADAQAYGQRAGVLVGFCGVFVGLLATQAREIMSRTPELSSAERWIAVVTLAAAVLLIAASALMALNVLATKRAKRVSLDELTELPTVARVSEPKGMAQGREMRGLIEVIETEQRSNGIRRKWLDLAARTLVAAVLFLVVHVGVFLVDASNGPECPFTGSAQIQIASAQPAVALSFAQTSSGTPEPSTLSDDESPFACPKLEDTRKP